MTGQLQGSVLISLVTILFAALLVATPPLALMTLPRDAPAAAPASRAIVGVSALV